jgi:aminopeptidase N
MRWWDDLWLNEAFAEWVSYLAITEGTEFTTGWTDFTAIRKTAAYAQDQLSTTHPIATDMIDIDTVKSNFDMISYAKGASALQQLAAYCGRENFIKGLQNYFTKFAYKNTTLSDLINELAATSGRDLKPWVATWIQTAGVNTLRSKIEVSGDTYSSIAIAQEAPKIPAGSTELRQHRLAVGLYDLKGNELVRRRSVELDVSGPLTEVSELRGEKVADLVLVNDSDLTYAKVRLDSKSIGTLKSHIGKLTDGLSRTVCWSASWDMMRDAELSASDYINIVLAGLGTEDDITVLGQLLVQLNSAVELYTSDKHRDAQREKVANALESLLNKATPESDHQLQFARAFASLAATPSHGARIRELLEGKLAGLKVDSDLRWHFVTCLVERGLSSPAEVAQELEKDNTFTGQLAAELCNAAFPTKEAKVAAWKKATEGDHTIWIKLYNIRGYNRPLHRALHVDFIDQYLGMLLDTWANSSYEISSMLIQGLFPTYVINQPTLTKIKSWIATTGKDAHPSLKRFINEGIEAMERALKVQALEN